MRDMRLAAENLLLQTPDRATFNLDSQNLTTVRFGEITPTFLLEVNPGDAVTLGHESLVQFMPLTSPVMHRMVLKTHYFYVPNRILWQNWPTFIAGQKDKITNLEPAHPFWWRRYLQYDANGNTTPRLARYFGFKHNPDNVLANQVAFNPFPFAAYQCVWNYYYRHRGYMPEIEFELQDGEITQDDFRDRHAIMRKITFSEDYFTNALPTPQDGTPAFIDSDAQLFTNAATGFDIQTSLGDTPVTARPSQDDIDINTLYARAKINVEELRRATALQRWLEANMAGHTYDDFIKAHYNVDIEDYRVQQPEYIGGSSQPIMVSQVTNLSDAYQGRLTGAANGYASSDKSTYYAREHGVILGLSTVTYEPIYTNALDRFHTKISRFQYYFHEFDGLGEQGIYNVEISADAADPYGIFGYVPRYHELRKKFDTMTAEMRTTYLHWHLGRKITDDDNTVVPLNDDFFFVPDDRRIFQYQNQDFDPIILQTVTRCLATRPMAKMPLPQVQ